MASKESDIPDVVIAEPTGDSPEAFWQKFCVPLGSSRLQYIGLDGNLWEIPDMCAWVKELRNLLGSRDPKRMFLTSIIIMAWWEDSCHGNLESLDRFNDVVYAGAKLRRKHEEFYRQDGADFLACFQKDLHVAGLFQSSDTRLIIDPVPAPTFASEQEAENYRQRMEYYANPPFKLHPDDMKRLLQGD